MCQTTLLDTLVKYHKMGLTKMALDIATKENILEQLKIRLELRK